MKSEKSSIWETVSQSLNLLLLVSGVNWVMYYSKMGIQDGSSSRPSINNHSPFIIARLI